MALVKKYLKTKPICKVTFKLPKEIANGASQVSLLGQFNDWKMGDIVLARKKDGSFSRIVDLEVGNSYQYRYVIDGSYWENDDSADYYVPSGVSSEENCVVEV